MNPGGPGRSLKNFLEVVRFILTEYGPMGSHGDPAHDNLYRFGTHVAFKLSDFDLEKILLHMDAELKL